MDVNADMNQYITPLAQNDPRLFSNVSQAFSLVDLGKRLLDAAKNGDVDEVRNLIVGGAPFTTDWLGISPLHFSSMNGHLTTCEALLKAGISRDARTKVDRTPLHLAAQEGHADIVELLLKNGADLEAKDMLRMTALHWAAERGHSPVVQVLVRYGANAHLQNKFEMTPLEIAEFKGHTDAHEAMLNKQVDVISSVGKMAAPSDALADANAFILTDEETLIPAAPPADEVTVTTALLPEEELRNEIANTENNFTVISAMENVCVTLKSDDHETKSGEQEANVEAIRNLSEWITPTSDACLLVGNSDERVSNQSSLPQQSASPTADHFFSAQKSNSVDTLLIGALPLGLPERHQNVLPQCETEDLGPNMIFVETPDGRLLHVRQREAEGSSRLVIFTEDGTPVEDEDLYTQVVDAIASLPPQEDIEVGCETEPVNGLSCEAELNGFSVEDSLPPQKSLPDFRVSTLDNVIMEDNPTVLGCVENLPSASLVDTDTQIQINKDELLAQLISFASDVSQIGNALCVDGVCDFPSRSAIIEWFAGKKLSISDFRSHESFSVNFSESSTNYTLKASYDPDYGSITFTHLHK